MRGGRVYVSYAAADRDFAERLFRHFASSKDEDGIVTAGRDELTTGADEKRAAGAEIDAATVGVLLVSSDFFSDSYVQQNEVPHLERRHDEGSFPLLAVRLRPCVVPEWLESLDWLLPEGREISKGSDAQIDADFAAIVTAIRLRLSGSKDEAAARSPAAPRARRPRGPDELPPDPYPDLGAYRHPALFRGRDKALREMLSLLRAPRLVCCLHAASGTGKTSFLQAGLIARLRSEGQYVAYTRGPRQQGIARRLLEDIVDEEVPDLDGRPIEFGARVRAFAAAHGTPVFVLDQFEEAVWSEDRSALARIGPLMAATAQPGGPEEYPCRWILSYRAEAHGAVVTWLEDVLSDAKARGVEGLSDLPYDLSRPDYWVDKKLAPLGEPDAGATPKRALEQARRTFLSIIAAPLRLRKPDGAPRYPVRFQRGDACRLAQAFAEARVDDSYANAPLAPELQVVLASLVDQAGPAAPGEMAVLEVGEHIPARIRVALRRHLEDRLHETFHDGAPARKIQALLMLRDIADRRPSVEDFANDMDSGDLLERLSSPTVRLIIQEPGEDSGYRYVLPHDSLAEAVREMFEGRPEEGEEPAAERPAKSLAIEPWYLEIHREISGVMAGGPRVDADIDDELYDRIRDAFPRTGDSERPAPPPWLPWGHGRVAWWGRVEQRRAMRAAERAKRANRQLGIIGVWALVAMAVCVLLYAVVLPRLLRDEIEAATNYPAAARAYVDLARFPGLEAAAGSAMADWMIAQSLAFASKGDRERALLWRLRALELRDDDRNRREIADLQASIPRGAALPHDERVVGGALGPGGKRAVTWTRARAYLWDASGAFATGIPLDHENVGGAAFDALGRRLVTWSAGRLKLWDVEEGRFVMTESGRFGGCAFDDDGRVLVAWGQEELIFVDATSGSLIGEPAKAGGPQNHVVEFRGHIVARVVRGEDEVSLFDTRSATRAPSKVRHQGYRGLALSPTADVLATWSNIDVRLWRTSDGTAMGAPFLVESPAPSRPGAPGRPQEGSSTTPSHDIVAHLGPHGDLLFLESELGTTVWDTRTPAVRERFGPHQLGGVGPEGRVALLCKPEPFTWDAESGKSSALVQLRNCMDLAFLGSDRLLRSVNGHFYAPASSPTEFERLAISNDQGVQDVSLDGDGLPVALAFLRENRVRLAWSPFFWAEKSDRIAPQSPVTGDPASLLSTWQARLALTFGRYGQIQPSEPPAERPTKGEPGAKGGGAL